MLSVTHNIHPVDLQFFGVSAGSADQEGKARISLGSTPTGRRSLETWRFFLNMAPPAIGKKESKKPLEYEFSTWHIWQGFKVRLVMWGNVC